MYVNRCFALPWLLSFFLLSSGCDSGGEQNDFPVITRAVLTLQHPNREEPVTWGASQSGGLTGGLFVGDTLVLRGSGIYDGRMELAAEDGTDVTDLIRSDPEQFQIFYQPSGISGLGASVTDRESEYGVNDENGDLPVGLRFNITTQFIPVPLEGELRILVGYYGDREKSPFAQSIPTIANFRIRLRTEPG